MRIKIITMIILIAILFSLFSVPSFAFELSTDEAESSGYYLYNVENDIVMASDNLEASISPSSTVKIMTACIALESNLNKSEPIIVTEEMLKGVAGRSMGLEAGDRLTVEDLLYACICGGYNDAAQVLAYTVSGDLQGFVDKMNEKAAELGMTSTKYLNVTGINASGMYTTVRDIAILAEYMSANDEYVTICATKSYRVSSVATCERTTINNRSSLLASYKGLSSFNTGSGDGDCTVLYYSRNGISLIVVVMNVKNKDPDDANNYAEIYSKKLLYHALNDYSVKNVVSSKISVGSYPVKYTVSTSTVDVYLQEDIQLFLPNDLDVHNDLTYSVSIDQEYLEAPLKVGEQVGYFVVSDDGKILAKVPLIVKEELQKNEFLFILDVMRDYILSRAFAITLITFILLMTFWYLRSQKKMKKMYRQTRIKTKK